MLFQIHVATDLCEELLAQGIEHEHPDGEPALCERLAARIDGWIG